ncbi:indolepyruvate/phenylpyruvate decarboxylase [Anderseniella sp. Alg231-50]|uniref:indolepyruvate/phenylpyruvate decarboxylase n=1 Tax=Anderseniella sp. Alg231-50 TaxID=1922226 RepID=UPI000D55EF70
MKLAHALLQALKDYGAGEIFGIPGDFALPLFRQIERINTLPLFTLSHEPAVGFAADAAGRYRGTLGVACVTYGAGALNMINPVATAYAEKSPLVVISGAPGAAERTMGLGLHHQVKHFDSQMLIMREVTCAQCVLDDPATAPAEIARVLTAARHLSRPVYIEFPRDMVEADVSEVPSFRPPAKNVAAAKEAARQALKMLKAKKQPAMLLGVEIRRYGLETKVAKLAKTLGIPVLTTFMGRGILAEVGAETAGTYLGLAGDVATRRLVERADGLLMLGVILCDTNFGVSKRQIDMRSSIHAFDGAVHFEHHSYAGIILEAFVDALLAGAEKLGKPKPVTASYPRGLKPSGRKLLPQDVATAVNDFFANHGVMPIASDMGDCLFTAMDIEHTALLAPGYYATMGTGIPFGLGLQAASGKRPLVLVGDGAFQMTGWELGNCRRLGLNPVVLLFNNTAWGMLKAFQKDTGYNDLDDWNFAEHAETMGGRGMRVSTPAELTAALEQAHSDESSFQLIEIMLPADVFSRTLTRFTDAISSKSALAAEAEA